MNKLITPQELNNIHKADTELNKLINLIKQDSMTFSHLCSKEYWTQCVIPTYKSDLKIIDVRVIDNDIVDIETNMFIITFHRKNEEEGITSNTINIVNDIDLLEGTTAEVEVTSGYMDEMTIHPLMHGGFHFIYNND